MSVDFRARDFAYPSGILRLRRFLEKSQRFLPEQLREYQDERLRRVVHHAYYHVPYYRRIFDQHRLKPHDIRKVEDLRRLPLLSKGDVRANCGDLCADNVRRFRPATAHTSGTTGAPLEFLVDRPSNILESVYYWRHWSWTGYRLGDSLADERYDYFIRERRLMEKTWHFQPHLRRLLLNSMRISRERVGEYAYALRKYRPKFIYGLATSLRVLAVMFREKGFNDIRFSAVFTGGEKVTSQDRQVIEETFGCKVLDSYGHMKRCVTVSQCPQGGYHINSEYGILELTDERKTNDGAITGRVVGTSLHKMAMPFLRYETEDMVELHREEKRCPCSRTLPLVKAVHGRKRHMIVAPDGRLMDWLPVAFDSVRGVRFHQFVQEQPGRLLVRIVPGKEYTSDAEETLKGWLRVFVGDAMKVTVEHASEEDLVKDERGMPRLVVSSLSPS